MGRYTKESVLRLREAVDIVDLISRYVPLKRAGSTFKGLCPFHDEKTPSFIVNKASRHYHCFGCGAHGDALSFLMEHERFEFKQALEFLAERYGVPLELAEGDVEESGPSKGRLKQVNEAASHFFHTFLLHADEAVGARDYLAKRGCTLSFLQAFVIGYAPKAPGELQKYLHSSGFTNEEMEIAGLLSRREGNRRDFFSERITFPILDTLGATIGFSARKWKEETFGGKYINTIETPIFKKSKVLFGLFYSKKRMMRDRVACLVEGQVDALRLIEAGFDFTVASLGTAFGGEHVEQLRAMGVDEVYLTFDQDEAGLQSAEKAGHLLMKKGIGVRVVRFSDAKDPDELLLKKGKAAFFQALAEAADFLPFLLDRSKATVNWSAPQEKDKAVRHIEEKIREWENPILVYESLKQLASLAHVPESLLNIGSAPVLGPSVKVPANVLLSESIEPDLVLELDLVRWLLFAGPESDQLVRGCSAQLTTEDFIHAIPRQLFSLAIEKLKRGERPDLMSLAAEVDIDSVSSAVKTILGRPQLMEKALPMAAETVKRIKQRNWLKKREAIRKKMEDTSLGDEELLVLARQFDELTKNPPVVTGF